MNFNTKDMPSTGIFRRPIALTKPEHLSSCPKNKTRKKYADVRNTNPPRVSQRERDAHAEHASSNGRASSQFIRVRRQLHSTGPAVLACSSLCSLGCHFLLPQMCVFVRVAPVQAKSRTASCCVICFCKVLFATGIMR